MIRRRFELLLLAIFPLACGPSAPADEPSAATVTIEPAPAEPNDTAEPPAASVAPPPKREAPSRAVDNTEARAEFKLGIRAYRTGDYAIARAHFDTAYRLSHKAPLLYNLIQVANKQGDAAGACNYYRELQQRAASDTDVARILGRVANPCPKP